MQYVASTCNFFGVLDGLEADLLQKALKRTASAEAQEVIEHNQIITEYNNTKKKFDDAMEKARKSRNDKHARRCVNSLGRRLDELGEDIRITNATINGIRTGLRAMKRAQKQRKTYVSNKYVTDMVGAFGSNVPVEDIAYNNQLLSEKMHEQNAWIEILLDSQPQYSSSANAEGFDTQVDDMFDSYLAKYGGEESPEYIEIDVPVTEQDDMVGSGIGSSTNVTELTINSSSSQSSGAFTELRANSFGGITQQLE